MAHPIFEPATTASAPLHAGIHECDRSASNLFF
jgi:hypothetical protein